MPPYPPAGNSPPPGTSPPCRWVEVPDPVDPVVHLYADARSAMQADQLLEDYAGLIRSLAEKEEALV